MDERFKNVKLISYKESHGIQTGVLRIPNEGDNGIVLEDFDLKMSNSFFDLKIEMFCARDEIRLDEYLLSQARQIHNGPIVVGEWRLNREKQKNIKVIFGNNQQNIGDVVYMSMVMIEYFEPITDSRN